MKTITVVDDDPGLRDAFRVIFDQNNFTVNIYPDGEPILANECPVPDVYILDKQLNGVDGLDGNEIATHQAEQDRRDAGIVTMAMDDDGQSVFGVGRRTCATEF